LYYTRKNLIIKNTKSRESWRHYAPRPPAVWRADPRLKSATHSANPPDLLRTWEARIVSRPYIFKEGRSTRPAHELAGAHKLGSTSHSDTVGMSLAMRPLYYTRAYCFRSTFKALRPFPDLKYVSLFKASDSEERFSL